VVNGYRQLQMDRIPLVSSILLSMEVSFKVEVTCTV